MTADYDYLYKFLLIGDSGVGKSSIMMRFSDDEYDPSYVSTIGVDFKMKTIDVDSKIIKLQIWDTAGQERFKTITRSYYRGANGVIVVYDITDKESYDNIKEWLFEIDQYAGDNITILIIGNKSDLENDRAVSYNEAQLFANERNIEYIETSAKDNSNINDVFYRLCKKIKSQYGYNWNPLASTQQNKSFNMNSVPVNPNPRTCCTIL